MGRWYREQECFTVQENVSGLGAIQTGIFSPVKDELRSA
jgi:hypothetical protein